MLLNSFHLDSTALPPGLLDLRREVRDYLAEEKARGSWALGPGGWQRFDPEFSRKLGRRGWIGMTWPRQYGGHERTALERYVVTEELVSAGAPLRAHWTADRQVGPNLLRYGTEEQKATLLPKMAAGEYYFCVGLSEPNAGSDLAAIRTRGTKVDGGWNVEGQKIWTSSAHRAQMMILSLRTSPQEEDRHKGISQFLVDMASPGITVRPILNLAGEHDFNEVFFDNVFVPDSMVVGTVGNGWNQASGELAYERSGSDRWLGNHDIFAQALDRIGPKGSAAQEEAVGRQIARLWTLHRMSFAIAQMLENGVTPNAEAALVKDLATNFDQQIPDVIRQFLSEEDRSSLPENDNFDDMLRHALKNAPGLTIRGGTREILRGIIARGLGLR